MESSHCFDIFTELITFGALVYIICDVELHGEQESHHHIRLRFPATVSYCQDFTISELITADSSPFTQITSPNSRPNALCSVDDQFHRSNSDSCECRYCCPG